MGSSAGWRTTGTQVIRTLLAYPVPVVAGVQGAVAGAGIGLVGACDIVICARATKIRPAYGALGFSPDGGTSWALARSLGAPRALDLMLTNGALTAAEAHLNGLVARLVEDEDLRATAVAVAHEIAEGPIRAMVRTRALVRGAAIRTLEEQLDDEARLIAESAADPEGREGVRAASSEKRVAGHSATRRSRTRDAAPAEPGRDRRPMATTPAREPDGHVGGPRRASRAAERGRRAVKVWS